MASKLHDFPNTALVKNLVAPQLLASTTTVGTGVDMLQGDGNCFAELTLGTFNATALTVQIYQSTATNSGAASISGASVSATTNTTNPLMIGPFQRDKRYITAVATVSGTTIGICVSVAEQLKYVA